MKKLFTLIYSIIPFLMFSQHQVTTILDAPTVDVDDALTLDRYGNLYGSHFSGNSVYKITPSGDVSVFVTGLNNPNGLAFDSDNNLYVVEYSAGAIHKYDFNGNLLQTFNVGGYPSGLVKEYHSNNMIFTNVADNSVNRLSTNGTITVLYQGAPLNVPVGLAFSRSGELFIGNFIGRKIHKLDCNGTIDYVATIPDSGTDSPYLAFLAYANGRIYATNYGEHKIYAVNPNVTDDVSIFSGSVNGNTDGDIADATYSYPAGIVASRSGRELYISEYSGLGNIRKITRNRNNNCKISMQLSIAPNPAKDYLNVKAVLPSSGEVTIEMYNLSGFKAYEEKVIAEKEHFSKSINVANIKSGIYELVLSIDGERVTEKVILEK